MFAFQTAVPVSAPPGAILFLLLGALGVALGLYGRGRPGYRFGMLALVCATNAWWCAGNAIGGGLAHGADASEMVRTIGIITLVAGGIAAMAAAPAYLSGVALSHALPRAASPLFVALGYAVALPAVAIATRGAFDVGQVAYRDELAFLATNLPRVAPTCGPGPIIPLFFALLVGPAVAIWTAFWLGCAAPRPWQDSVSEGMGGDDAR